MRTSLLGWLDAPATDRGIRFARPGDGWDEWSYARLAALAERAAAGLADAGVRHGDVVCVVAHSSPQFVAALFGALAAGATPSPVAPPLAFQAPADYEAHLAGLLTTARPALVACGPGLGDTVFPVAAAAGVARVVGIDALLARAGSVRRAPAELALLQFTSGTSGRARGVLIPPAALAANVAAIRAWLEMTPADETASWLPVHHDMGLIGCLLTPIATGADLSLLAPEEFVRSPLRYLRCFDAGGAVLSAMPGFGLAYAARRIAPEDVAGLDLRAWRALIVGAERIDAGVLERFEALLAPAGFARRTLLPAYGLAEATLAVTGLALHEPWRAAQHEPGGRPVVGCGRPLGAARVEIRDADGLGVDEGVAGEIAVSGPSVAAGYAAPDAGRIAAGTVQTGDAGFMLDGQLFVLGRLGDALKIRGRSVFAEDLEAALAAAGIPAHRQAAVLGEHAGAATVVLVLEDADAAWVACAEPLLRRRTEGASILVVDAPRGTIARTSSGKPKRRELWSAFLGDRLPGTLLARRPAGHQQRGLHA